MNVTQGSLSDVLNALEQLDCAAALLRRISKVDPMQFDLLCSVQQAAVEALMLSETLMKQFQSCPGPYWRQFDGVMQQLQRINEGKKRKMSLATQCTASPPVSFDKAGAGPEYPKTWNPEQETRRALCNHCYQIWMRDKKGGIAL